jgi:hypothetical protein
VEGLARSDFRAVLLALALLQATLLSRRKNSPVYVICSSPYPHADQRRNQVAYEVDCGDWLADIYFCAVFLSLVTKAALHLTPHQIFFLLYSANHQILMQATVMGVVQRRS